MKSNLKQLTIILLAITVSTSFTNCAKQHSGPTTQTQQNTTNNNNLTFSKLFPNADTFFTIGDNGDKGDEIHAKDSEYLIAGAVPIDDTTKGHSIFAMNFYLAQSAELIESKYKSATLCITAGATPVGQNPCNCTWDIYYWKDYGQGKEHNFYLNVANWATMAEGSVAQMTHNNLFRGDTRQQIHKQVLTFFDPNKGLTEYLGSIKACSENSMYDKYHACLNNSNLYNALIHAAKNNTSGPNLSLLMVVRPPKENTPADGCAVKILTNNNLPCSKPALYLYP